MMALYGLHRYILLYLFHKWRANVPLAGKLPSQLPAVTVQLPIYNEQYVVERLVEAVCNLDYPKELLEIQILDDSNDETFQIARELVEHKRENAFQIFHLHREDRKGFKAGALQEGLEKAHGEFIAIFDADFVPPRDFLMKTIPHFSEPKVGMVQARWGHLNENYSLLTKTQAIFLDAHFVLEHGGRNRSSRFMSFNGTAGIWRKEAILQAGGWQQDTLTEDLDLSYRAQLAGWKFVFLPDLVAPAELPIEMNAFKTQQHRWTKGAIQTARKILPRILKSTLPWKVKLEAFFHLTNSSAYLYMFIISLLLFPAFLLPFNFSFLSSRHRIFLWDIPLFLLGSCSISAFYLSSRKQVNQKWWRTILFLPIMMAVGIGISLTNAKGVLEWLLTSKGVFERTPKFAVTSKEMPWTNKAYRSEKTLLPIVEILLGTTFAILIGVALKKGIYPALPFLLVFAAGYYYVGWLSLFHARKLRPRPSTRPA